MAIGTPVVITTVSTTGGSSATNTVTSGSFTPGASAVVYVGVLFNGQDGGAGATTISMSNGGSPGFGTLATAWTQVKRTTWLADGTTDYSVVLEIWACKVGASPGAGTVTATRTAGTIDQWFSMHTEHVTGADVPGSPNTGSNHATTTGTSGTFAITLTSTPATNSMVFGLINMGGTNGTPVFTPPTGWTEGSEVGTNWGAIGESAYKVSSAVQAPSWSFSGSDTFGIFGIAAEIPEAGAAPATKAPAIRGRRSRPIFMRRAA